jgi:hypothetical protein
MILWQVAEHCGPTNGQAIVHVAMAQVHVAIDDETYWVENLSEVPIVRELRPGRHRVCMLRDDRVIYQEEFTLAAGQERILTAWNGYTDGRCPGQAN